MSAQHRPENIARTAEREHANGAPGTWWVEYRVRELTHAEQSVAFERTGRSHSHALEERHCHEQDSEYCTHHTSEWRIWDYGASPKTAAESCIGDTCYSEAHSLSPLHRRALATLERDRSRGRRIDRLRNLTHWRCRFSHEWRLIDYQRDERERAESRYVEALKRARLYSKAMRNEAPPEKLEPIRAEVRAEYKRRLAKRERIHNRALRRLVELGWEGARA